MFDASKLTDNDKLIISDFFERRKLFDKYIDDNKLKLFTCPGCGYPTLTIRGSYEVCDVCNWEDDDQDDNEADEVWGGPNGQLSLTENRINIGRTLNQLTEHPTGHIVDDPHKVLNIIKIHADKKANIKNKMTGFENREDPLWTEWDKVEKDLQNELINKNTKHN